MIEGRFTIDEHITGVVYRTKSEINNNKKYCELFFEKLLVNSFRNNWTKEGGDNEH